MERGIFIVYVESDSSWAASLVIDFSIKGFPSQYSGIGAPINSKIVGPISIA
jgi:hypothetical protein